MPKPKEQDRSVVGWIVAFVLLGLPAAYIGAYLLLLRPVMMTSLGMAWPTASYRVGGEAAIYFFYPVNLVDRQLRPAKWHPFKIVNGDNL